MRFCVVGFNWKIKEEDSLDGPVIRVARPITPIIKQQECILFSLTISDVFCFFFSF